MKKATAKVDPYQRVTDKMIELLEAGTVPWKKPWSGGGFPPKNAISGKGYRGINFMMLGVQGYGSPFWMTFKQSKDLGGSVRKGEKATPIVFWKIFTPSGDLKKPEADQKRIPMLKHFNVFNAEQVDGLPEKFHPAADGKPLDFEPIAACEAIVDGWSDCPKIEDGPAACYQPVLDRVLMPAKPRFESVPHYYATLFHELGHSTGHHRRLDRNLSGDFGSQLYSKEELVAEMVSAFLCGEAGLDNSELWDNSAAYVASWLKALKDDKKLVVNAAAAAQKAADLILGREYEFQPDTADTADKADKADEKQAELVLV